MVGDRTVGEPDTVSLQRASGGLGILDAEHVQRAGAARPVADGGRFDERWGRCAPSIG
jgi:hypothetical protein